MTNTAEPAWSQSEQLDPSVQMADLDFENFLDIGDANLDNLDLLNFQSFDTSNGNDAQNLQQPPNTPFNGETTEPPPGTIAQDFYSDNFDLTAGIDQHHFMPSEINHSQMSPAYAEQIYQPSLPQRYGAPPFALPSQHGFPRSHGHSVPPTPNSYEMHGDDQRAWQQQMDHRTVADQRYRIRKDDAIAFTPLVSPAGTPHYQMQPEFTVNPGAYEFSPLTSPMLHAQNAALQQQHQKGYYTNPSTAPNSNATSPIDPNVDVDMLDGVSLPEPARKTRRKAQTPRSAGMTTRATRQSPIVKAQKRKSTSLLNLAQPSKEVLQQAQRGPKQPHSAGLQMPHVFGNDSSEAESISPEPLSEALMGPPPRPGSSLTQSPLIQGQLDANGSSNSDRANGAATPQTLLSMRQAQGQSIGQSGSTEASLNGQSQLDDLVLPESATSNFPRKPSLAQINTSVSSAPSAENTPRVSARKTPKLGPLSTPSSARLPSASASPSISAFSPTNASTPAALLNGKRSDSKGPRGSKKRGNSGATSATLLSPAIRPKISPSIKPLLPEGSQLNSHQQALLLASKSNYQNILEGNHLPGVVYPEGLSTGLTSKRTSHKVAEQGRRNRINDALKEMQTLLPPKNKINGASGSDGSPEAGNGPNGKADDKETAEIKSNNSKAATVESACLYVRQLQKENAHVQSLARENEQLKKRLAELEVKSEAQEVKNDSPNDAVAGTTE